MGACTMVLELDPHPDGYDAGTIDQTLVDGLYHVVIRPIRRFRLGRKEQSHIPIPSMATV